MVAVGEKVVFFSEPNWQSSVTNLSNNRMIPDVSLDADPYTGYQIYYNGSWNDFGGTSASTPEWAAIFSLVDEARKNNGLQPIGLANPILYSLSNQNVFNDITSGSNGNYSCLLGYDMVTGLGSVDTWKLITTIDNLNTQTYYVSYNGNGNTGGNVPIDSNEYLSGNKVSIYGNIGNLVRTGYVFSGWNTKEDGTGTTYLANSSFTMENSNITLYAKWTKILAPIGCIDTPTNGSTISGINTVRGWFLDSYGVQKVEVLVDGNVVGTATYGDQRNDVYNVFPSYNTTNGGYHYGLDTTKLSNGTHTIVIRETGNNNVQTSLNAVRVTVINNAIGCIDTPTNGSTISGINTLRGWFLDDYGVQKVEVLVDGNVVGTATYGDQRNDVYNVLPSYNTTNGGYHYSLDTTKLSNGTHTIVIRETGNNNVQTSLKEVTINIKN